MNKICLAAIVLMAGMVVSCNKETEEDSLPTFTAHWQDDGAKASLVGSEVRWQSTDRVKVFGDYGYALYSVAPREDNPTWATLTASENHDLTGLLPYRFVYPADMAEGGTSNNNTLYVTFPAQTSFSDGALAHTPMYGESSGHDVTFHNLSGILKINLQQADQTIREVIVEADEDFVGKFSINASGSNYSLSAVSGETDNSTRLLSGENALVDISDGVNLYVAMPAGEYHHVKVTIINNNGRVCEKGGSLTIEVCRSQITTINVRNMEFTGQITSYEIDGEEYEMPQAVDLGLPSGTLWASSNLGGEDYYRMTHYGNSYFPTSNDDVLCITYNTLEIPTEAQFQELLDNCDISYQYYNSKYHAIFTSRINNNTLIFDLRQEEFNYWGYFLARNGHSLLLGQEGIWDDETNSWTYDDVVSFYCSDWTSVFIGQYSYLRPVFVNQ